jgi:NADPH:quinone reductase-like Zn-dependent oxidoreductase
VLVRVRAAAVTSADWRFRSSSFPFGFRLIGRLMFGLRRPRNSILGMDFSGVVEATGQNVTRFRAGDRVFGAAARGAHAEYVAVKESSAIVHKPALLSDAEAAAIPFGGNTALAFLRDFVRLQRGQRVLIVGASGAVGSWAVQLARHLGAQVTGVCSTPNLDLVRSLGAEQVLDYSFGNWTRPGGRYDVVFDTVGVTTFAGCKPLLSDNGTYIPLNSSLREIVQALFGSFSAKKVKFAISQNTREGLEFLLGLIESGAVRPVVDRVYPMAEIVDAHRHVEGRHKRGSVILAMS